MQTREEERWPTEYALRDSAAVVPLGAVVRFGLAAMLVAYPAPLTADERVWLQAKLRDISWQPVHYEWLWLRPLLLQWAEGVDAKMAAIIARNSAEWDAAQTKGA